MYSVVVRQSTSPGRNTQINTWDTQKPHFRNFWVGTPANLGVTEALADPIKRACSLLKSLGFNKNEGKSRWRVEKARFPVTKPWTRKLILSHPPRKSSTHRADVDEVQGAAPTSAAEMAPLGSPRAALRPFGRLGAHSRPPRRPHAQASDAHAALPVSFPPRVLPEGLGRKPRTRVSDAPPRGRGPSRTLTFWRRVFRGRGGSHRGRRCRRRRRGRLARRRRRRVRLGVGFRLRVPAWRAAPGTRRRELQDRPSAGYHPGLLPHREPERELRASGSREGRCSARRCVINIHASRHRLLRGYAFNGGARVAQAPWAQYILLAPPPRREGGLYSQSYAIGYFGLLKGPIANGKMTERQANCTEGPEFRIISPAPLAPPMRLLRSLFFTLLSSMLCLFSAYCSLSFVL